MSLCPAPIFSSYSFLCWQSHLLNQENGYFSNLNSDHHNQPLTAPATIPLMICLLNAKYRTTIGAIVISIAAICFG